MKRIKMPIAAALVTCSLMSVVGYQDARADDPSGIPEDKIAEILSGTLSEDTKKELEGLISQSLKDELWSRLNTGPDGNLLGTNSALVIQSYNDNQKFNAKVALGTSITPAQFGSGNHHEVYSFALTGSAPLEENSDKDSLPNFDGLANSWSLGFTASYSRIPANTSVMDGFANGKQEWIDASATILQNAVANPTPKCEVAMQRYLSQGPETDLNAVFGGGFAAWMDDQGLVKAVFPGMTKNQVKAIKNSRDRLKYISQALQYAWQNQPSTEEMSKLSGADQISWQSIGNFVEGRLFNPTEDLAQNCAPEFYKDFLGKRISETWQDVKWTQTFGLDAKAGREVFDFHDPTDFGERQQVKTTYSATAFAAINKAAKQGSKLFKATVEYQKAYKAMEETTKCRGEGAITEEDCMSGIFGAPVEEEKFLITGQSQYSFEKGVFGKPIAFTMTATYDIENDVFGLDAPIYLFSLGGDKLNAGFRIGWRSDTDDAETGFFVGQTF